MISRFALSLALLGSVLGIGSTASAQTSPKPHLDLVRGLRNNGLADLAEQYLVELKAKNPPPDIAILLPLEFARTWLERATQETDEAKRNELITRAKNELDTFIKAIDPKHPQAAQANVELAKLVSLQGKSILAKARRLDNPDARKIEMDRARADLKKASEMYGLAVVSVEADIKKYENDKSTTGAQQRRDLTEFRLRSLLDQGINLFYMAETFVSDDADDVIARGVQYKAAKKIFEKVMYQDEKEPLCWVARAWSAESDFKIGDTDNSNKAFQDLLSRKTNLTAASGIRTARYFGIFHSFEKNEKLDARGKLAKAERDAADWLRDYAAYRNTAEGLGARYYLAFAKLEIGKNGVLRDKDSKITGITPTAKASLEESQRIFKELVESENEYTDRATRFRSQILVTMADADGHGDAPTPESLGNFERCYLMAQVQTARFLQFRQSKLAGPKAVESKKDAKTDPKKEPKKEVKKEVKVESKQERVGDDTTSIEEQIKREETIRYTNAIRYLEYGLKLVSPSDSIRDVFSAQMFLVRCYYHLKMYPQAAVLAEYAVRTNPKLPKAPAAGIAAVNCYNAGYIKMRRSPEAPPPQNLRADVERLRRAAQYMVDKFPTDSATDEARHILGFFIAGDKNYPEAWKVYADIKPSYGDVLQARLELCSVMFAIIYPTDVRDAAQFTQMVNDRLKQYDEMWKRTIGLMESIAEPDEVCSSHDAVAYINGRAELVRSYQLEHKNDRAQPLAEALLKSISKFKNLNDEQKKNLAHTAQNLVLNSVRAAAFDQLKLNNHAKVAELLNPKIEEMKKDFAEVAKEEPTLPLQRLRKTQREVLVLALQSSVQDQKIDKAGEYLDMLEKAGGSVESSMAMLRSLVGNVRNQIEELDQAGKKAESKNLKEGFAKLLDRVALKSDKLPVTMKMFIAQGYQSVDAFGKAEELLTAIRKLPAPPKPEAIAEGASDEQKAKFDLAQSAFKDHEKLQHQVQYFMVRNFHLGKDYPKALALLAEMIGPTSIKAPIPPPEKRGWAFFSMEVRREKAAILEEMAQSAPKTEAAKASKWGTAVQEWTIISKALAPRLVEPPDLLSPQEKAIRRTPQEREKRIAELEAKLTPEEKGKRSIEVTAVAAKRAIYFELYFEAKRCSTKAYFDLGPSVTKGDMETYQGKFTTLARDFHDLQTKNKDLSQTIKDKVKALIDEIPLLKQEYKKIQAGN